jgi:hypothetical protein
MEHKIRVVSGALPSMRAFPGMQRSAKPLSRKKLQSLSHFATMVTLLGDKLIRRASSASHELHIKIHTKKLILYSHSQKDLEKFAS